MFIDEFISSLNALHYSFTIEPIEFDYTMITVEETGEKFFFNDCGEIEGA